MPLTKAVHKQGKYSVYCIVGHALTDRPPFTFMPHHAQTHHSSHGHIMHIRTLRTEASQRAELAVEVQQLIVEPGCWLVWRAGEAAVWDGTWRESCQTVVTLPGREREEPSAGK